MTVTPYRDEEIRLIWKENQWLYMVVGFIAGLLFCLLTQLSVLNLPELIRDLLPEAAGIFVTITVIDYLNRRRAIKQVQEQLVRDASSIVNNIAINAVHQLNKRGWLFGDNGLLKGANLRFANLQGANLFGANLQGADLFKTNLQEAALSFANLQEANLELANLQGETLSYANLQKAYLLKANLQGADLFMAKLQGACLVEANLQEADLHEANLRGADLFEANLQEANLKGANLQGADLLGANLRGADLFKANLQGAKLEGSEWLVRAEFDENTILPDGSHWTPETDMTRFTQPDNEAGSA
jgi:uncharacterized protein YjbI with pentapeptide repeats